MAARIVLLLAFENACKELGKESGGEVPPRLEVIKEWLPLGLRMRMHFWTRQREDRVLLVCRFGCRSEAENLGMLALCSRRMAVVSK